MELNLEEVATKLVKYYQNLFTSVNPPQFGDTLHSIYNMISEEMNEQLSADFMEWEFQDAIKQMAPLKAPKLDGMPPFFYHNYWQLVSSEVTQFILSYLNSASLSLHLNHTFITLIPKVKNPEFFFEFQPISLCNVL